MYGSVRLRLGLYINWGKASLDISALGLIVSEITSIPNIIHYTSHRLMPYHLTALGEVEVVGIPEDAGFTTTWGKDFIKWLYWAIFWIDNFYWPETSASFINLTYVIGAKHKAKANVLSCSRYLTHDLCPINIYTVQPHAVSASLLNRQCSSWFHHNG